jgi:hypothetical protein
MMDGGDGGLIIGVGGGEIIGEGGGAYKAKERGVISDEKCEKLIIISEEKARPVLLQALKEFASQLNCQVNC